MPRFHRTENPVIIAGAGPCGLVAALTLEKAGIPYVIYERTTTEKLCSNAGSGIDMAPTGKEKYIYSICLCVFVFADSCAHDIIM